MPDSKPTLPRSAGVLLHPTSLPGPFGTGDLGPTALRWVDALAAMRQQWWQILPLGPTGAGDSPYQSFSAFAGSITLLSPELLERDGLVSAGLWAGHHFPADRADFGRAGELKRTLVRAAWEAFRNGKAAHLRSEFEAFCHEHDRLWLHDYALFTAVREGLNGAGLADWPADLGHRKPAAVAAVERKHEPEVMLHKFGQFLFDRQWAAVKRYANEKGVKLIGDIPIFVAPDSADVWAHRKQFLVDAAGRPKVVAGVPPDYFATDGQLWGNPIYDWPAMAKDNYAWWAARVRHALRQVDLIRLDHFRGFVQAWHVPADATTAKKGKWVDGGGRKLFDALRTQLGGLPFIAEDLGLITPDVHQLREELGLPGMRVLQFGTGGADSPHLPHNYDPNTVAYTGTHDNDTTNHWYQQLNDCDRYFFGEYVGHAIHDPAWEMIRLAWGSVARLAVAPLQDVLGLGGEARMNKPGVGEGNWGWRLRPDQVRTDLVDRLAGMTYRYARAA